MKGRGVLGLVTPSPMVVDTEAPMVFSGDFMFPRFRGRVGLASAAIAPGRLDPVRSRLDGAYGLSVVVFSRRDAGPLVARLGLGMLVVVCVLASPKEGFPVLIGDVWSTAALGRRMVSEGSALFCAKD